MSIVASPSLLAAHLAAQAVAATAAPAPTSIAAEVNRIEAALSLALHSVQTHYDADVAAVKTATANDLAAFKSKWSAFKANVGKLVASHSAALGAGAAAALVIRHFV